MRVAEFDFELPLEHIALRPSEPRDAARLLCVGNELSGHVISDLPNLLRKGDVLVFNDTKVIPASLSGYRIGQAGNSAKIDILLHQRVDDRCWRAFARPAKKLHIGDALHFGDLRAQVTNRGEAGEVTIAFHLGGVELDNLLEQTGRMPLPPYIESRRAQDERDRRDYQTIFAEKPGAVAAPTASLHFTQRLIRSLQDAGIQKEIVTLHVGAGTFLPVKAEDTGDHKMHSEWGEVSAATSVRLKQAKAQGRRIIPVGTTSLRLLEASGLEPFAGNTDIFITPGYTFRATDALFTNFHLPRSTLFMLVSAFAGLGRVKQAYAHAIQHGYRFYSYGDASLLFPKTP